MEGFVFLGWATISAGSGSGLSDVVVLSRVPCLARPTFRGCRFVVVCLFPIHLRGPSDGAGTTTST